MLPVHLRAPRALCLAATASGLLALSTHPALAQQTSAPTLQNALGDPEGLTVEGSVRARYEAIDNQFRPGKADSRDALLLQTDLKIAYDTGPVEIGGEVTDARAYGGGKGSSLATTEVDALDITQAYLRFNLGSALGEGTRTSLEAGRFTMDMGSRRLVARNRFRNTINAFSGFRADWKGKDGQVLSAFYTMPVTRLPSDQASILDNEIKMDTQSFDQTFWGGFASSPVKMGGAHVEAYFYALDEEDSPGTATKNRHLRTAGGRFMRPPKPGTFDFDFEGAYQFGNTRLGTSASAARADVSAYFAHGELAYQATSGWKPRLALELDVASGNKGGGSYNRFDTLYGARRFEFGPTSLYGALGRNNIRSAGAMLKLFPSKRILLATMYRAAWADSTEDSFSSTSVTDASGEAGRFAGHQIEGLATWWAVPKVLQIETGATYLIRGDYLKNASSANGYGDTLYGYVSAQVNF
ncbi:alginate export family protein [Novosphingobium profundi]|uniref:alginate export family protein n=1 Tax=Novosphingobium profundi TaxID=1774954 RepID=UPI001BDB360C|nr:alginate export family protein [Novosphingobium profundi]MBT0668273.1 alginate export family protein [Novosphingobium profundi]